MGYGAIALKAGAKTFSMTLKMDSKFYETAGGVLKSSAHYTSLFDKS
jgi:hypothetical protein